MCAGVVPQQPPIRLIHPSSTNRFILKARLSGVSPYWPRSSGRPAFGYTLTYRVDIAASVRRWSVMNSGPVAQLSPMENRSRCSRATVERLDGLSRQHRAHRLDGAADHEGQGDPAACMAALTPMAAALTLSVSCTVSSKSASTPPSMRARAWSAYASRTSSNVTLRVTVIERVEGPMAPATKRSSPAASRAIRAAARVIS
jgi:hypothetical protein